MELIRIWLRESTASSTAGLSFFSIFCVIFDEGDRFLIFILLDCSNETNVHHESNTPEDKMTDSHRGKEQNGCPAMSNRLPLDTHVVDVASGAHDHVVESENKRH